MSNTCSGEHRFFAVETVGVESEGKVHVLALCTACGDFIDRAVTVSSPGSAIRLLNEEKKTKAGY